MPSQYSSGRSAILKMLIFLFFFQDLFQSFVGPLKYMDELFALCLIPLFLLRLWSTNYRFTFTYRQLATIGLLGLFWMTGFVGFALHRYQPIVNTLMDSYVAIKFFMAIGASFLIFYGSDYSRLIPSVYKMTCYITVFLFTLTILDLAFHIFPTYETRFGLRAVGLYYSSYTILVADCTFLCTIFLRMYEFYPQGSQRMLCLLWFIMFCTLRSKAFAAVFCMIILYIIVCRMRRMPGVSVWGVLGAGAVAIAASQFMYYFRELGDESARYMLTNRAITIAKDYFPFGTGWSTYGSAFSINPYSPVYRYYQLDEVWGLSPKFSLFVSDTFWPMVLGQTGVVGIIVYVIILLFLVTAVFALGRRNAYRMASALGAFLYLVISSTSESAFVNGFAIPMAMWMGLLFAENRDEEVAE